MPPKSKKNIEDKKPVKRGKEPVADVSRNKKKVSINDKIKKEEETDSDNSDLNSSSSDSSSIDLMLQKKVGGATGDQADNEFIEDDIEINEEEPDEDDDKDDFGDTEIEDDNVSIDKSESKDLTDAGEDDTDCVYRPSKKKKVVGSDSDSDNVDSEEIIEDNFEDDLNKSNIYVADEDRITTSKLTKYERVDVIGVRAKQISYGAQPMVKTNVLMTPEEIAKLEIEHRVCPIKVKRVLPTGEIELIDINTLKVIN
jgi:DNA-directed RNA polymerase subunit K